MNKFIISFLFCILYTTTYAQFKIGATGGLTVPAGTYYSNLIGWGLGGSLHARYFVNKYIGLGLNAGIYNVKGKHEDSVSSNPGRIIPITATIEYFLSQDGLKPYVMYFGLDAGVFIESFNRLDSTKYLNDSPRTTKINQVNFGIVPTFGFNYTIYKGLGLDVNGKINVIFQSGGPVFFVGVNAGVYYSFGKFKD